MVIVDEKLKHIAFIMDGNGRWAINRGLSREAGHTQGAKTFERVVKYCGDIGVKCVTVYAFSTENWSRPKSEVDRIMLLLERYLDRMMKRMDEYDVCVRFIGDKQPLSDTLKKKIQRVEESSGGKTLRLNIALNYGGRAEIVHAVNTLISRGTCSVTEEMISENLYTADCPPPDLIVRTAGEQRLSNFLMWQSAYSEFYFTDTLWPDLKEEDIDLAVESFYKRTRRFGGVLKSEAVPKSPH
ncbi:MAG: di-trans,poly-cis-decaprenylcistransferase [Clostridia bacterium]|nr:di-trans,poly-cis-decaprenylcistransferase [Clostridia bacterium]